MTTTHPSPVDVTRELLVSADTNIPAFFAAFTDDCRFRMGNAETVVGRANIQTWVANYLSTVSRMRHHVLEEFANGDVAALRVEVTYTMQNGAEFTLPAITRTKIRDNKICEYLIFMDASPVAGAS
jgi:limonene-1,2-epoxide hydrolase